MPVELKTHVLSFIDSLDIEKKGELYNKIISHLEVNRKKKAEKKRLRISISDSTCISCEG